MSREYARKDKVAAEIQRLVNELLLSEVKDPRLCGRSRERRRGQRRSERRDGILQYDRARRRSRGHPRGVREGAWLLPLARGQALQLRRVPELRFRHDTSARRSVEIGRLIDDAERCGPPVRLIKPISVAARRVRGRDVRGVLLLDKPRGHDFQPRAAARQTPLRCRQGRPHGQPRPARDRHAADLLRRRDPARRLSARRAQVLSRAACLGIATDTDDADGAIDRAARATPTPAEADVRAALARFMGEIEQVPPMYSALKRDGVPLYRLARARA